MNSQLRISISELIPAGIHTSSSTILINRNARITAKTDDKHESKPSKNKIRKKNWKENLNDISKLKESNNKENTNRIHDQSNMYLYAIIK